MKRSSALTVAALLLGVAVWASGCSSAAPPPGRKAADVSPPTPDAAARADAATDAPDGDAPEAGDAFDAGADAWAGTWKFVSGSQGIACGGNLSVVAVSGFLDITPSISGTLLLVQEDGCSFHFDLAGDVATEEPDQFCSAWSVPTIPIWTLTLQRDGTLHEKIGGGFLMGGDVCTISGSSTLVRQ